MGVKGHEKMSKMRQLSNLIESILQEQEGKEMQQSICEFVRRNGQRVGVLLGVRTPNGVIVTGSKVNLTMGDRFDRERALEIAWDRVAVTKNGRKTKVASSMAVQLEGFADRCRRFFKTDELNLPELSNKEKEPVSILTRLDNFFLNE